jgi:hypothetical protein
MCYLQPVNRGRTADELGASWPAQWRRGCERSALGWMQERHHVRNDLFVSAVESAARLSCSAHWPVLLRDDDRPGDTPSGWVG